MNRKLRRCRPLDRLQPGLFVVALLLAGGRRGSPGHDGRRRHARRRCAGRQRQEALPRPAPVAGGADRALSRRPADPDPRRLHLPARDRRAPAVSGEASRPEGQGAGGLRRQAALGPEHPVDGGGARGGQAPGRRHPVDHRAGERVPGPAERGDGRGPGDAEEGEGQGRARDQRAAEGRDEGDREDRGDRGGVGEPRGHLRAVVQPRRWCTARRCTPIHRSTTPTTRRARRSSRSRSA